MTSISATQLREGQIILVRGKTAFSRLARVIEGEALTKRVAEAKARGQLYPTSVPHTTISLSDAQVVYADPSAPTPEELYTSEKTYDIKKGENAGKKGFSVDNRGNFLPVILEQDPDNPGEHRQLVLPQDLAVGLDVTLVLNVFASGDYANKGLGIQYVILNEPVRYYASGVDRSELAARGLIINGEIRPIGKDESTAAQAPADSVVNADGVALPGQLSAPQAPVAPAAPVVPQPAQPVQAPVQGQPSPEQAAHIAQLQQQLAEAQAAQAGQGGASAFTQPAQQVAVNPWD